MTKLRIIIVKLGTSVCTLVTSHRQALHRLQSAPAFQVSCESCRSSAEEPELCYAVEEGLPTQ